MMGDFYHQCFVGNITAVKKMLNQDVDINLGLTYAGANNQFKCFQLLLEAGADPSYDGYYAIHIACQNGHADIVKLLLQDRQVDPTADDNLAIRTASYYGHVDGVTTLLQDGRADPAAVNNYALRFASEEGHVDVVEVLLQDGRVEVNESAINNAATEEIKDMLIRYKYRVDGEEYQRCKTVCV